MKLPLLTVLIFVFSISTFGQTLKPCSPNFLRASIRGFRLGLTKEQIETILPNLKWAKQTDGTENAVVTKFPKEDRFMDLKSLEFVLYEHALYITEAIYFPTDQSQKIASLTGVISKNWGITEKFQGTGRSQMAECRERTAIFSVAPERMLYLSDSNVIDKIKRANKPKPLKP